MPEYAILRFAKKQAGAVACCDRHNERKKKDYKSNPDIETGKSKDNIHLIEPGGKYMKCCTGLIEEAGCRVRKNSVIMVETLITASPEFFENRSPEETNEFFEKATAFLSDKIGRNNIVSAVIHLDEKTPHMHLCFCPITKDGRLSAKDILGNKKECSKWQDSFYEYMSADYPELSRGVPSYVSKRKHIPVHLFKEAAELDRLYPELQRTVAGIRKFNGPKQRAAALTLLNRYLPKIKKYEAQLNATSEYISRLEKVRDRLHSEIGAVRAEGKRASDDLDRVLSALEFRNEQIDRLEAIIEQIPDNMLERLERKAHAHNGRDR